MKDFCCINVEKSTRASLDLYKRYHNCKTLSQAIDHAIERAVRGERR